MAIALIIKDGAAVKIRSRNDKDLTYPAVATAARRVYTLNELYRWRNRRQRQAGPTMIHALQHRGAHPDYTVVFYAFDLLHLNGEDISVSGYEPKYSAALELAAVDHRDCALGLLANPRLRMRQQCLNPVRAYRSLEGSQRHYCVPDRDFVI